MEVINYIIDEALILIPVLNVLGQIIKGAAKIPDKYIPLILLIFGVAGTMGICGVSALSVIQ